MVRVIRLGKLGKLIRVTKIFKVLKIIQLNEQSKEDMKVNQGIERMCLFTLIFFISIHVVACVWIFVAGFQDPNYKDTWIASKDAVDYS